MAEQPVVRPQDCDCGVMQGAVTAHSERCASRRRALPVVRMPDLVTYKCPECGREFSHAEPFEAHGMYLDHQAEHDGEPEAEGSGHLAELAAEVGVTVHDPLPWRDVNGAIDG